MARLRVFVESGSRRVFATAADWPGWSRSGRTEADALAALVTCQPRYALVARRAGLELRGVESGDAVEVAGRLAGTSGTDFGVPSVPLPTDVEPLDHAALERHLSLLRAAWETFDRAAAAAEGVELRKGPRGGGRDLARIREHVLEAEGAYLHQLGTDADHHATPETLRAALLAAITASARGDPLPAPNRVKRRWSPRYAVRRTAWHALDHAWEIQDRSQESPAA